MAKKFGITSTGGYGILQSVDTETSVDVAKVKDANGKTVEQKAFSKKKTKKYEGVLDADTTTVEAGVTMTAGTDTMLITQTAHSEKNTEHQKFTATAELEDAATIVAYAA